MGLRNDIGIELAKLSLQDGMENLGLIYPDSDSKNLKISLRSIKDQPGGNCQEIANYFDGGGHYNAAGFYIDSKLFKKWLG